MIKKKPVYYTQQVFNAKFSQYFYRLPSPEQDIICVLHEENNKMR